MTRQANNWHRWTD